MYFWEKSNMVRGGWRFLAYPFLLGALFLGQIALLRTMGGKTLMLEMVGFFGLLLLTLVGFLSLASWGERALFAVFVLFLGNILLVWYFLNFLSFLLLAVALLGFGVSLLPFLSSRSSRSSRPPPFTPSVTSPPPPRPYSEVFEESPRMKQTKTTFSPGKYVGSTFGATFHEPKSEWAKKIKPQNRVWFSTKEEAEKKGYQPHPSLQ